MVGTNLTGDYGPENLAHEGNPPILRTAGPRSFLYGPSVEIRLPHRFSVDVTALHRPISSATETTVNGEPYRTTSRAVTWVFPVLAKYRIPVGDLEPFIALGPSFRLRQTLAEAADASPYGVAAAVGIEKRVGAMRIAPSVRYTHWAPDRREFGGPYHNQVEALFGFSF
jgi:hypothetical protein